MTGSRGLSAVFFGYVMILFASGCFQLFEPGPATFVKKAVNPAKTRQAILFMKGGNATESNSLQVSVKDAYDKLDTTEVGNVFTTDADHGKAILDSSAISLVWKANDKLLISYDKELRTFIMVKALKGVVIEYKTK